MKIVRLLHTGDWLVGRFSDVEKNAHVHVRVRVNVHCAYLHVHVHVQYSSFN